MTMIFCNFALEIKQVKLTTKMKNKYFFTLNLSLLIITTFLLSVCKINAQVSYGVVGYETKSTVNTWDAMKAYDAAHPELHTNIKNIPESEFSHVDFMHSKGIGLQTLSQSYAHPSKSKSIQVVSPAPQLTFQGQVDNGTSIPPDCFGAVGPNHVFTAHNQDVRITNKTGVQTSNVSLDAFWTSVIATGGMTFDPKEVYDPYSNRYIITALWLDASGGNGKLLMGVSATNNPTGTWYLFSITVDATNTNWMDFPELGFNKNWIAVGGNLFNVTSGASNGGVVYVFNKNNMYSNTNAQYTLFSSANDFCITPAMTYDANLNNLFCMETYDGTTGKMRLFKISGTPSTPTMNINTPVTMTSSLLWAGASTAGTDFGIQSGTTNKIDCGDDRLTSICYRSGKLWASYNAYVPVANPTRVGIEWWQTDTIGAIQQNAMIEDATNANFYVYPSIAVNANGDALMGFTNLGSAIHPSSGYCFRLSTDALNTFESPYIYKSGLATYYKTFGGQRDRWGDYSATAVDPVDDQTLWTVTEYAETPANTFATMWAKVSTCLYATAPTTINGPSSICSTNATSLYYTIAPSANATSYTWTVTGTGWTSVASTVDSILVTPGTGNGTITVTANNACGASSPATLTITVVNGVPATPGAITGNTSVCGNTNQTYSVAAVSGATSYTWTLPSGWSGTSTTNTINTTVGSVGVNVTVVAVNGCGSSAASSLTVSLPTPPAVTTPVTIACGATATLNATGADTLKWFNQSSGGNPIATGGTYTTPALTTNTTYYVESDVNSGSGYSTPYDSTMGAGSISTNATRYEIFTVNATCTLVSVLVYSNATGNRTFRLENSAGVTLDSVTTNIAVGSYRVTLNFPLTVGTNFRLAVTGTTISLYRNTAGVSYPYSDPNNFISITGSSAGATAYYYCYDWQLAGPSCNSGRTPVNVIVTTPTASFTYTNVANVYTFTNTSTGSTSWLWKFGDGNTSNQQNPTHTYGTSGTFVVTLYAYNGSCIDSTSQTITLLTTGINSADANANLSIYPNPVNDHMVVSLNANAAGAIWNVRIYDILGNVLLSDRIITISGANQKEFDLSKFAKGIYSLEMENNGNKIIRKVVKD